MDLRRKIFLRVVLLIFLLIAAIVAVIWVLKQDIPPHNAGFAVIIIAAIGVVAFLLGILLDRAIARMTIREVDQLTKSLRENEARLKGIFDNMSSGVAIYDDVTERKQAAETIEEWRTRYQAAIDASGQILYDWDSATGEAVYGGSLEPILGYTQEDMEGGLKRWKDLIHPDDRSDFDAVMERGLKTGGTMHGLYRVLKKDGEYTDIEDTGKFLLDSQGNLVHRLGFLKNITELKQAEIKLSQSEEKFRSLVENMSDFVFLIDPDLRIITLNHAAAELIGDKTENIIGKQVSEIFPPHVAEMYEEGLRNVFETATQLGTDSILQVRDLNLFLNTRLNPILDDRKKVIAVIGVSRDITDRKRAEDEIKRREQYLLGLNDAAQTLLIPRSLVPFQEFIDKIGPAANASRAYVFINRRGSDGELIASRKAEWCADGIDPTIDNPLPQDLSYKEDLPRWGEALARGKGINSLAADFPERERELFKPYAIRAALTIPIMIENEFVGFIGFDNCVSDREWDKTEETFLRAAANDLAQAISRARSEEKVLASLKEKEVLLREIHHRVKNNMQVIVSLLRMHSRRIEDTRVEQVFNDCRDRVYAMSLIHEALYQSDDLARIDFETCLNKLCRNLDQVYGVSSKGITLTVKSCDAVLNMDQSITVGMVISELITNSIKHAFTANKGGAVSISLTRSDKDNVELIVEDNGKGLPLEIDILNPPELGLQLVVSAVTREWGGSIEVDRNGGTRFVIRFKCKIDK